MKHLLAISAAFILSVVPLQHYVAIATNPTSSYIIQPAVCAEPEAPRGTELERFLEHMARIESSGILDNVNPYGYLGLYQFSPATLNDMGFDTTRAVFLNSKELQDSAMVKYMRYHKKLLRRYIKTYAHDTINGIYITEAGILAGAHLVGAGGVIEFFKREGEYKMKDGNNVHVSKYIEQFSKYDYINGLIFKPKEV